MKILLLDNYDSFTFNLLHYLQNAGAEVNVVRNDTEEIQNFDFADYDAAVISPGPGKPSEAGYLMDFLKQNIGVKPILGVCLGMQAIGQTYGWELKKAVMPMHGKSTFIQHSGVGIFNQIPNPMQVGRYHSLVISPTGNSDLKVEAETEGEVMAVSDEKNKIWGVQFHPESVLTPNGQLLIQNWAQIANL